MDSIPPGDAPSDFDDQESSDSRQPDPDTDEQADDSADLDDSSDDPSDDAAADEDTAGDTESEETEDEETEEEEQPASEGSDDEYGEPDSDDESGSDEPPGDPSEDEEAAGDTKSEDEGNEGESANDDSGVESEDRSDAEALSAAGDDADQNFSETDTLDPVHPCASENEPITPPLAGRYPRPSPPPPPMQGNLEVTVLDAGTEKPIDAGSVVIKIGEESKPGQTNPEGKAIFRAIKPGDYSVVATASGYTDGSTTATVQSSQTAKITLKLTFPCWQQDYTRQVSVNAYGRYYKRYNSDGSEAVAVRQKQYKIVLPFRTGSTITVEFRFKASPQEGVTDDNTTAAKTKLESAANTYWTGKFTLQVDDPRCGKKSFPIVYKIVWVTSGEDYILKIFTDYPRAGLSGSVLNVGITRPLWTYVHEFGHCSGLPDEYSYSSGTESVKYIKVDGSLDSAVSAPPNGRSKTDPAATIMSATDNYVFLKRHAWNIAIEVQEYLTSALGRAVKCAIL